MPLVLSLLISLAILTIASTLFCCAFQAIEGYWPRWHFNVFLRWWWPFRAESAATLAAVALDVDDACSDWLPYELVYASGIESRALKTRISENPFGGMRLIVDGTDVPLSLWDEQLVAGAYVRWNKRRDRVVSADAKFRAASIFAAAFKEKYHRGSL